MQVSIGAPPAQHTVVVRDKTATQGAVKSHGQAGKMAASAYAKTATATTPECYTKAVRSRRVLQLPRRDLGKHILASL